MSASASRPSDGPTLISSSRVRLLALIQRMRDASAHLNDPEAGQQIHSERIHSYLLRLALNLQSYEVGPISGPDGQEFHELLFECLLFSAHYLLRHIGHRTEVNIDSSRVNAFLFGLQELWNLLWRPLRTILENARPSSATVMADLVLHYYLLTIRFRSSPPSLMETVNKISLFMWTTSISPFTTELLLRSLLTAVNARQRPESLLIFFQRAVTDSGSIGPDALLEQFDSECIAEEVNNKSLVKVLQFMELCFSNCPAVLETNEGVILRSLLMACHRQHCHGKEEYTPAITIAVFRLLSMIVRDLRLSEDASWPAFVSVMTFGSKTLKLVNSASRAIVYVVKEGTELDLNAVDNVIQAQIKVLITQEWVNEEPFEMRPFTPKEDCILFARQVWRPTMKILQELSSAQYPLQPMAINVWAAFGEKLGVSDQPEASLEELKKLFQHELDPGCSWPGCLCFGVTPLHGVRICTGCYSNTYCNELCQRKDRRAHRIECYDSEEDSSEEEEASGEGPSGDNPAE